MVQPGDCAGVWHHPATSGVARWLSQLAAPRL